jgi:hypothetical protein
MALDPVVNFFQSEIATLPVASGGTVIVLSSGDGAKLPNPAVDGAFNLTIYEDGNPFSSPEIVRVTGRSSDTLTVTRAQEGTTATTKIAGTTWKVVMFPTAKTIQDIDSKKVEKTGDTMTGTLTATKFIPSGNVTAGNGMYLPAANTVAVSTNGVERYRVDSSGNVGIGTTAPANPLHMRSGNSAGSVDVDIMVQDSSTSISTTDAGIIFTGTGTGGVPRTDIPWRVGTRGSNLTFQRTGTEHMRITDSGNVGIGTTAPATPLDVNGTVTGGKFVPSGNVTAGNGMYLPAANTVAVSTDGVERYRVTNDGNVLIGTIQQFAASSVIVQKNQDDSTRLSVRNATSGSNAGAAVVLNAFGNSWVIECGASSKNSNALTFAVDATASPPTERMRITTAGNVGIGTTNPSAPLHTFRSGGATNSINVGLIVHYEATSAEISGGGVGIEFRGKSAGGNIANYTQAMIATNNAGVNNAHGLSFYGKPNASDALTEHMRIDRLGNVGIGTTNPTNLLTVNGIVSPSTDNARTLGTASLRWSEVFAGNGTINTSDATEKQDIAELNVAEHQVATALKGLIRKYRWIDAVERKGEDARIHVGVMAQDVAQSFEDAGLDAEHYGVFCKDVWYTKEETYTEQVPNPDFDEEAEEGEDNPRMIDGEEQTRTVPCESDDPDATEHIRYGVRYDQLWAFIISAL